MILSVILVVVILLSLVRFKYAILLYLAYSVLVPRVQLQLGSVLIKENVFSLIMLLTFFLYISQRKFKLQFRPFIPFFLFFALNYVAISFQTHTPDSFMIDNWRGTLMKVTILPFILWNLAVNDEDFYKKCRLVFFVCIGIVVLYGLGLIFFKGYNPYYIYIQNLYGGDTDLTYFQTEGDGRLFGRISSVFLHPMSFGLFLGLSIIYIYSLRKQLKNTYFIVFISFTGVMMLLCGVRSCIVAVGVTLTYYLIKVRNFTLLFKFLVAVFCVLIIISFIPGLDSYVLSIFETSSNKVEGSSIEMRLDQLDASLAEIRNDRFWGLGYSWTMYYYVTNGLHPQILGFESLIFVIICNNGVFGFFIWLVLIIYIIWNTNNISGKAKDVSLLAKCVFVYYISFSCFTGEYDYMRYFSLFYILILLNKTIGPDSYSKLRVISKKTDNNIRRYDKS